MKIESHADYPQQLAGNDTVLQAQQEIYQDLAVSNIENYIGTTRIPIGLAGPVTVLGEHAKGTFHIPMATTEGTLVASTARGMKIMNECGGVTVQVVRNGGIQRAPVFEFDTIDDACEFAQAINDTGRGSYHHGVHHVTWQAHEYPGLADWANSMCTHDNGLGRCFRPEHGQHLVPDRRHEIVKRYPSITRFRMGGGISGEKTPSSVNTLLGRGKAVTASVTVSGDVMRRITRAEIADIPMHQQNVSNFAMWGGSQASHNSIANTIVAMYIACGQDVAATVECRWANNIFEYDRDNDSLRWDVHIPNIIAGTVGGGTGLPTQRECLELIDCHGSGKVDKFVELCAVAALANEISFWGALCAQEWIDAHASLKSR